MKYAHSRINIEEYEEAKKLNNPNFRTIQAQVSWWSKIGRYALDNPDLTAKQIVKLVVKEGLKKQKGHCNE